MSRSQIKSWAAAHVRAVMLLATLAGALLLAVAPARAHFDADSKFGKNDYLYGERTLCYRLWGKIEQHPSWAGWAKEAADNWNQVSAQTGWSFRACAEGEKADIVFTYGAVAENSIWSPAATDFASGVTNPDLGHTVEFAGKGDFCMIKIVEDVSGHQVGKAAVGKTAGQKGWGKQDDSPTARTLDPVQVAMHELTHCMKLDHPPGALDTPNYEDPVSAGVHAVKPISADDINQTHASAAAGKTPQNILPKARTCVRDEADRASIKRALEAMLEEEKRKLKDANDLVFTKDADHARGYAEARQATSNIEALQAALANLPNLPLCSTHASAAPTGAGDSQSACRLAGAVIDEINRLRAAPADYAAQLRRGPQTDAVRDAAAYLDRQSPLPPLEVSAALAAAAQAHAAEQGAAGGVSHTSADGSTPMARAQARGVWATVFAEEIAVSETSAAGVVRALVIDASSPSHQHRQDLLSPTLRLAGVGCAPHRTAGVIYVLDLTNPPMAR